MLFRSGKTRLRKQVKRLEAANWDKQSRLETALRILFNPLPCDDVTQALPPFLSPSGFTVLDWEKLDTHLVQYRQAFFTAAPFPWLQVDDFLKAQYCAPLNAEFEEALAHKNPNGPKKHRHVLHKTGSPKLQRMGPLQQQFFLEINSPEFLKRMEFVTGISPLYADDQLVGGGLHEMHHGGYLNVHTDFNVHPQTQRLRSLNILIYLNPDWDTAYGGELELWPDTMTTHAQRIEPRNNRMVMFQTSECSFHGVPNRLKLPAGKTRRSLAAYYYTDWPANELPPRDKTNYQLTPLQRAEIGHLGNQFIRLIRQTVK